MLFTKKMHLCIILSGDIMSYDEYNNLFLKCQNDGIFETFTFDIKNSKKMDNYNVSIAKKKLYFMISMMYLILRKKEIKLNNKILIEEDDFSYLCLDNKKCEFLSPNMTNPIKNEFGFKIEPFKFGDMVGITVYKNSISVDDIMNIYNILKKEINIDFDIHISYGYYETNNYNEANFKYFRGYAIELLSNLHKPNHRHIKNKVQDNIYTFNDKIDNDIKSILNMYSIKDNIIYGPKIYYKLKR